MKNICYNKIMGFFSKLFKKKEVKYSINKINEDNLVVMVCPKNKVKLNSKICVPEKFCAVVLSKEKLLDEIPAGEFEISGLNFPKVCKKNKLDKPTKKGYKTEFDADFYFVNLKQNVVSNSFFIKKGGINVNFELNFNIIKPKKFLEFLLLEQICFENDYALKELQFYVSQIIYYFVLDNKVLSEEKLTNQIKNKLDFIGVCVNEIKIKFENQNINFVEDKIEDKFDKKVELESENLNEYYDKHNENQTLNGLINQENVFDEISNKNINFEENYDLDYSKKLNNFENSENYNNIKNVENLSNFDEKIVQKTSENESFSKKSVVNLDDIVAKNLRYFVCDNCGTKLPENSQKCFVCGKSFVEKNLCENCGKEISKNDYVCPHCGSVVIQ